VNKKAVLSILLLALTAAFFAPVLFFGRSFSGGDTVNYTQPMKVFINKTLEKGEFPLWNPDIYSGFPMFAESNTGIAYPLNLLFSIFPANKGITYNAAAHFFLSGIFMMLYASCFTESGAAIFLSMIIWVFSGMFSFRIDHLPVLQAMAYIPLFFFAVEKYARTSERKWLFITAAVAAAVILIGHGQTALYMFAAGCVYYPARLGMLKKKIISTDILLFGASLVFGLAMAAVQAIPTYELISMTARNGGMAADSILKSENITWINIINTLFPFLFGSVNNNTYIGIYIFRSWFISYIMIYTGAVSVFFYFFAARMAKNAPVLILFGAFMVFSLLFAMGANFPLNYLAVKIPVLNKFRNPAMMLEYYVFFTAALCAVTASMVEKGDISTRVMKILTITAGAGLAAAAAVFVFKGRLLGIFSAKASAFINKSVVNSLYHHYPAEYYMDKFVNTFSFISSSILKQAAFITLLCLAFLGFSAGKISKKMFIQVLAVLTCAELFINMYGYQPMQKDAFYSGMPSSAAALVKDKSHRMMQWRYYENESIVFKKGEARGGLEEHLMNREIMRPDQNTAYGVLSFMGYSPVCTKKYYDYYVPFENAALNGGNDNDKIIENGRNILDAAAVKYILSPYPISGIKRLKQAGSYGNLTLYERAGAPGLVNFAPQAVLMKDDNEILKKLNDPSFDMKNRCIISSRGNGGENYGTASCPVNIEKWEGGHISFELTAPSAGYAVVSSLYYPGWIARVDGAPAKILNADYVFSAVKLGAGRHAVEMDYKPASFRLGLIVSAVSFLIFLALLCAELIIRKKKRAAGIVS
jgi:hypothetical protein